MKRLTSLVATLVLAAAPVFAAGPKTQTVSIPETVKVGTTQLPAGSYKLAYTGTGSNVQVTLSQAGKTVLTFTATAVEQKNPNQGVSLIKTNGTANLQGILLDKVSLTVNGAPQVGQ